MTDNNSRSCRGSKGSLYYEDSCCSCGSFYQNEEWEDSYVLALLPLSFCSTLGGPFGTLLMVDISVPHSCFVMYTDCMLYTTVTHLFAFAIHWNWIHVPWQPTTTPIEMIPKIVTPVHCAMTLYLHLLSHLTMWSLHSNREIRHSLLSSSRIPSAMSLAMPTIPFCPWSPSV